MVERHERIRVTQPEGGELKTKQSMAQATDINNIMSRWITHRGLVPGNGDPPRYGDFATGVDYHQALNQIMAAEQAFDALPAAVRDRVHNDVGEFLDVVHNPARVKELKELGLHEEQLPAQLAMTTDQVVDLVKRLAADPETDPDGGPADRSD